MLDDSGRVSSHITSVACQIQRFDVDYNLVVIQKLIVGIPALRLKPLYTYLVKLNALIAGSHRGAHTSVTFEYV